MLLKFAALLLALIPTAAEAGLRAVYVPGMGDSVEVKVADNGDLDADLGKGRRLIVRGRQSYVVTERLTGPRVHRLDDLAALAGRSWTDISQAGSRSVHGNSLRAVGTLRLNGRSGTAYGWPKRPDADPGAAVPVLVLSDDPALEPLAAAMRRVWQAMALLDIVEHPEWPIDSTSGIAEILSALERGAPLKYGDHELQTLEPAETELPAFALADAVEPLDALRARLERERREDKAPSHETDISRAVFAEGRLWMTTDKGGLESLGEDEAERRPEKLDAPVADICAGPGGLIAVTATRDGSHWMLRRFARGAWHSGESISRDKEDLVALSCRGERPVLLTTKRLIEPGRRVVTLSAELHAPRVNAVVHETAKHLFVGLNRGEWGGGLMRVERSTGRTIAIERNSTGHLCDGPLNAACDPVHGIATMPWKPSCVAVAIGLVHMSAHGRIAEVCDTRVETLFTQAADRRRSDAKALAEVAGGGYGSVAFFGLEAAGDSLLAVGQDGLYRLDRNKRASFQPWPRFREVAGLLVSFALPDVVLVLTTINQRASLSGAVPILVVR